MTTLQLSFILVASIWAAVNTVIAGYRAVNATRDRILTGCTDEGIPMSLEHRELSFRNDWIPLKLGLALVSVAFTVFLLYLPALAEDAASLRLVCWLAALVPFFSFLGFFVLGIGDYRALRDHLAGERRAPAAMGPARARKKTGHRRTTRKKRARRKR